MNRRGWKAFARSAVGMDRRYEPQAERQRPMPELCVFAEGAEYTFGTRGLAVTSRAPDFIAPVGEAVTLTVREHPGTWTAELSGVLDLDRLGQLSGDGHIIVRSLLDPDRYGVVAVHPMLSLDQDTWWIAGLLFGARAPWPSSYIHLTD